MKTIYGEEDNRTSLTSADRDLLARIVRLLGKYVELEPIGRYRIMAPEEVWLVLVSQVCVMGSALHIDRIKNDPTLRGEFEAKVSLRFLGRDRRTVSYLAKTLRDFSATRFPQRSAERLTALLESPTVFRNGEVTLFDGLSYKTKAYKVRDELIDRCRPVFRLKSASDFMISVGLSHDVIALDTRVVGIFQRYFAYNLRPERIQANPSLYLSLEGTLREFCREQDVSLALLDRILFRFGNVSAIELVAKYPDLALLK